MSPGRTSGNPLPKSSFTLDASGVAGSFGGDQAIYAMLAGNVRALREPANCPFWDTGRKSPSILPLFLNSGPEYIDIHAGTIIENTGRIGDLFVKVCVASVPDEEVQEVPGRITSAVTVTIEMLGDIQ